MFFLFCKYNISDFGRTIEVLFIKTSIVNNTILLVRLKLLSLSVLLKIVTIMYIIPTALLIENCITWVLIQFWPFKQPIIWLMYYLLCNITHSFDIQIILFPQAFISIIHCFNQCCNLWWQIIFKMYLKYSSD